jgi:hypothetical protein
MSIERMFNFYDSHDVSYDRSVMHKIYRESENAKEKLRNLLSVAPSWDSEKQAYKFECEVEYLDKRAVNHTIEVIELIMDRFDKYELRESERWIHETTMTIYVLRDEIRSNGILTITPRMIDRTEYYGQKYSVGQKITRIINASCKKFIERFPECKDEMTKAFNDFSNVACSKKEIKTFWLSVNPFDFMRMSHGNSWDSCHYVDGCHRSGAIDYALDSCSAVLYQENDRGQLISRQHVIFQDNKFYIGRRYGEHFGLHEMNKELVVKLMFDIDYKILENDFCVPNIRTSYDGTHYRDYEDYEGVYVKVDDLLTDDGERMGKMPICFHCGAEHERCESFICTSCDNQHYCEVCESFEDYDEMVWSHSHEAYVCEHHVTQCDDCGRYYDETTRVSGGNDVCNNCLESHYTMCDICEDWEHDTNITYVNHDDMHVCDSCAPSELTSCSNCQCDIIAERHAHDNEGNYYCDDCDCPSPEHEES